MSPPPSSRLLDLRSRFTAEPAGKRLFGVPASRCGSPARALGAAIGTSSGGGEPDEGVDGDGEYGSCGEYLLVRGEGDCECVARCH